MKVLNCQILLLVIFKLIWSTQNRQTERLTDTYYTLIHLYKITYDIIQLKIQIIELVYEEKVVNSNNLGKGRIWIDKG